MITSRVEDLEYRLAAATPPECAPILYDPVEAARLKEELRKAREEAADAGLD